MITNNEQKNEIIMNRKSSSSSSSLDSNENHMNNVKTLTNTTGLMMKQFIACTDGKSLVYYDNLNRKE